MAWTLGRDQGLFAVTFNEGEEAAMPLLVRKEIAALNRRIGSNPPKLPEATGDRSADAKAVADALLRQSRNTFELIKSKFGEGPASYYELGLRLQLLPLMYEPKRSSRKNQALLQAMDRVRKKTGLPICVFAAVNQAVERGEPFKLVHDEGSRADNAVRKLIWRRTDKR